MRAWSIGLPGAVVVLAMLSGVPSAGAEETLKFGITPRESPMIMFKKFTPLAQYLSKELGLKVELVVGKDFQAAIDALGKNEVSIALLTPTAYPKCERQYSDAAIRPIVRFLSDGKGVYRTCIFVPAEGGAAGIEELKGKTFAFGDKTSAASHLMPRAMLKEAGIDADKDFTEVKFLGSHTNVAQAVALKQFAAGGCMDSTAERFQREGKIKIIAASPEMPDAPICVNKNLPSDLCQRIEQALVKLTAGDPAGKAVLTSINDKYTGCEATKSQDYDSIREMVSRVYGDDFYKRD
jgi:phosphonate transport system substrate-binding protein